MSPSWTTTEALGVHLGEHRRQVLALEAVVGRVAEHAEAERLRRRAAAAAGSAAGEGEGGASITPTGA
jgi:hypothetical protein